MKRNPIFSPGLSFECLQVFKILKIRCNLHWIAYGNTLQFEVLSFLWKNQWMCDLQQGSICKEVSKIQRYRFTVSEALILTLTWCKTVSFFVLWVAFSSTLYPLSVFVQIPHLQANPLLIQHKCKAKHADINVIFIIVFLFTANLKPKPSLWTDCTHSGPPGPQLSCRDWTETRAPHCRCKRHHHPVYSPGTGGYSSLWRISLWHWPPQSLQGVRK